MSLISTIGQKYHHKKNKLNDHSSGHRYIFHISIVAILLFGLFPISTVSAYHGSNEHEISGTVTYDEIPIGGAVVVITNIDNGEIIETITDSDGEYSIDGDAFPSQIMEGDMLRVTANIQYGPFHRWAGTCQLATLWPMSVNLAPVSNPWNAGKTNWKNIAGTMIQHYEVNSTIEDNLSKSFPSSTSMSISNVNEDVKIRLMYDGNDQWTLPCQKGVKVIAIITLEAHEVIGNNIYSNSTTVNYWRPDTSYTGGSDPPPETCEECSPEPTQDPSPEKIDPWTPNLVIPSPGFALVKDFNIKSKIELFVWIYPAIYNENCEFIGWGSDESNFTISDMDPLTTCNNPLGCENKLTITWGTPFLP